MNLLTRKVPWTTWEFGLAKIGFILFGIIVGALWPEVVWGRGLRQAP